MVDPPKQKLINGKPVEDGDETTDNPVVEGSSDLHGEGNAVGSERQAGAKPPASVKEIKSRAKTVVERVKKDGPQPAREAALGLVDKAFDAVDAAFDKWFGGKKE